MRQEEEGEQVIQGLQGAGHQQVRAGDGAGGLGRQAGCSPLPFPQELQERGAQEGFSARHCSTATGHEGSSSRLCPRLQGVAQRPNRLQGIIIIKAGTGGLGAGEVIFGSGQGPDLHGINRPAL